MAELQVWAIEMRRSGLRDNYSAPKCHGVHQYAPRERVAPLDRAAPRASRCVLRAAPGATPSHQDPSPRHGLRQESAIRLAGRENRLDFPVGRDSLQRVSALYRTLLLFTLSILLDPKAAASITKRDIFPPSSTTNVAETVGANTTNTGRIFDELGRVTSVTDAAGYTVGYSYDDEGNLKTITYPGNRTVTYTYDGANRLKTVTDWNVPARVTTYNYDTAGRLDTVLRPNSTRQRVTFDNADRLTGSYEEKMSGTTVTGTLWQAGYGFDDAQRLTTFTPVPAARSLAPPSAAMTFGGDNQLATYNGQNMSYDLDGNLQSAPVGVGRHPHDCWRWPSGGLVRGHRAGLMRRGASALRVLRGRYHAAPPWAHHRACLGHK